MRAGTASNRIDHEDTEGHIRGRTNIHANKSKKSRDKIYFHRCYPDKNHTQANKSLKRGDFQDLSFASCLRFKEEKL